MTVKPIDDRPRATRYATADMIFIGTVVLLSGLSTIVLGVGAALSPSPDSTIMSLVLVGLLVGFTGAMLIWAGLRGGRP